MIDTQAIEAIMVVSGDMVLPFPFTRPGVEKSKLNIRVMGQFLIGEG
jgi:hypothetical protein